MNGRWLGLERVSARAELVRPHGVPALVAGAALLAARLLPDGGVPGLRCLAKELTSLPCPACGLTRGFVAAGHGAFAESWLQSPLSTVLFCATLLVFAACVFALAAGVRIRAGDALAWSRARTKWTTAGLVVTAVVANWIYRLLAGLT